MVQEGEGEVDESELCMPGFDEPKPRERRRRKKKEPVRRDSGAGLKSVEALLYKPDPNNVGEDIKIGMHDLLSMHNVHELKTLCHALDIDSGGTRSGRLARVYDYAMCDLPSTREVMQLMWEGTLIEYLRKIGACNIAAGEDPRRLLMRYWMEIRKPEEPESTPIFIPRTHRPRKEEVSTDTRVLDLLEDIRLEETNLKQTERDLRTTQDPSKITPFLQAITQVRKTEENGRNYLIDTLESLHAKEFHTDEALSLTTTQLEKVEAEHEQLTRESNEPNARRNVLGQFAFNFFGESAARAASIAPRWDHAKKKMKAEVALLKSQVDRSKAAHAASKKKEMFATETLKDYKRQYAETEIELDLTKEKIEELWQLLAYTGAVEETEQDIYFDLACDGCEQGNDLDAKIREAAGILVPLLRAPNPTPKIPRIRMREFAEDILVQLKVFTDEEMFCKKQQIAMWTEELEQRRIEAVKAAKDPKNKKKAKAKLLAKKKAGKKKGRAASKKKGKGGKKKGGKKKKK
jgi:hypothetical protein